MLTFLRKLFGISTNSSQTAEQTNTEPSSEVPTKKLPDDSGIAHTYSSQTGHSNKGFPSPREMNMKKFLIVGLGNIGPKYVHTRHNIGFKMVDHLAEKESATWETAKLGDLTSFKKKGRTFFLLKPSTYMNLSGKAVKYWMEKEKIAIDNMLIITDDLNLPFGTLRIKTKGSDGGHNGLKDIQNTLQTSKYPRFRFGISDEFSKGRQVDYVLGEWTPEEETALTERFEKGAAIVESFGLAGVNITMNTYNGT